MVCTVSSARGCLSWGLSHQPGRIMVLQRPGAVPPCRSPWGGYASDAKPRTLSIVAMARRGLKDVATKKKSSGSKIQKTGGFGASRAEDSDEPVDLDLKGGEYSSFECFSRKKGSENWLNFGCVCVADKGDVDSALQERAAKISANVSKAALQLATVPVAEREYAYEMKEEDEEEGKMVVVDLSAAPATRQPATLLLNEGTTNSGFGAFRSSLPIRSEKGMPDVDLGIAKGRRKL